MQFSESSTRTILQQIAIFFAIGEIVSFKRIPQGMSNPSYFVKTKNNKEYVIRILHKQTKDGVANEYWIEQQLRNTHIILPTKILSVKGEYLYEREGIQATVSEKLAGYHPTIITQEICKNLGKILAEFHLALQDTHLPASHVGWLNIYSAQKNLQLVSSRTMRKQIKNFLTKANAIFHRQLPTGIIHGDMIIENMLFSSHGKVNAILDLDESEENLLVLDVIKSLTGVCIYHDQIDDQLASAFLNGYNEIRPLTKQEKKLVPAVMQYIQGTCAAWFIAEGYPESAKRYLQFYIPELLQNLT